jgi:hypothetical protein
MGARGKPASTCNSQGDQMNDSDSAKHAGDNYRNFAAGIFRELAILRLVDRIADG